MYNVICHESAMPVADQYSYSNLRSRSIPFEKKSKLVWFTGLVRSSLENSLKIMVQVKRRHVYVIGTCVTAIHTRSACNTSRDSQCVLRWTKRRKYENNFCPCCHAFLMISMQKIHYDNGLTDRQNNLNPWISCSVSMKMWASWNSYVKHVFVWYIHFVFHDFICI